MGWISNRQSAFAVAALSTLALMPSAHAQDFFSALFGGMGGRPAPAASLPFNSEGDYVERREPRQPRVASSGGRQAFCVRTCDGRYFPISATDSASRAASCNNFCPSSETKVVYGSSIDQATTETGKSYSELPNAFKYRTELVAGCTCNGKDQVGLAPVKVEEDPTLRKGDIVAGAEGLMVTNRPDKRGASLVMSPAPEAIRAKFERPAQE
jgi:hypothetical protein